MPEKGQLPPKEVPRWAHLRGLFQDGVVHGFFLLDLHRRALLERKLPRTMLVEGFAPITTQVGQFIKFDEVSSSHGGHTLVGSIPTQELP